MPDSILVFGDIMGRIGREGVKRVLPRWKKEFQPALVIANVENLSHGAGITMKTITEMREAGIDAFTSGNHIYDKPDAMNVFHDRAFCSLVLRPENYPPGSPGLGYSIIQKNGCKILLINLMGRVFFKSSFDCPFRAIDRILNEHPGLPTFIDFHAEATSEKNTFGLYVDGRVTAVWGTHTHVPTADERLLPRGTAYITDVGMTGGMNGSIGMQVEPVRDLFLTQRPSKFEPIERGGCEVNAILLKMEEGTVTSIERLREIVTIDERSTA